MADGSERVNIMGDYKEFVTVDHAVSLNTTDIQYCDCIVCGMQMCNLHYIEAHNQKKYRCFFTINSSVKGEDNLETCSKMLVGV